MTCTFEKEENEAVVESLWQRHGDKIAPRGIPDIDPSWGLVTVNIDISAYSSKHSHHPVYYCYPHRFQGEGMFIALFDVCDHLSSSNSTSEFISQKKTKKNKNQKSSSSSALSSSTDLSTSLTLPTSSSTDFFKHRERPSKIIPSLVIQNIRSTCAKEAQLAAPFVNLNPTIDTNHFNYQSTTSNPSALPQQLLAIPSILFVSETHMSKKAAAAQLSSSSSRGRSNSESSLTTSNLNLHIIPEALSETMLQLASKPGLSIRKWGVHAGEIISSTSSTNSLTNSYKKSSSSRFSPSSELPVSLFAPNSSSSPSTSNLLNIQLSKEQALLYVQGKQFSPNIAITHSLNNSTNSWITTHETGWALVSYLGLNLGWCRVVVGGERVNIHYPKSWRPKRSLWEID